MLSSRKARLLGSDFPFLSPLISQEWPRIGRRTGPLLDGTGNVSDSVCLTVLHVSKHARVMKAGTLVTFMGGHLHECNLDAGRCAVAEEKIAAAAAASGARDPRLRTVLTWSTLDCRHLKHLVDQADRTLKAPSELPSHSLQSQDERSAARSGGIGNEDRS